MPFNPLGERPSGRMSRALLRRWHRPFEASLDSLAWAISILSFTALRLNLRVESAEIRLALQAIPVAVLCQLFAGGIFGLYVGRWRSASFEEVSAVVRSAVLATVVFSLANVGLFGGTQLVPRSSVVGSGLNALLLMAGFRFLRRSGRQTRQRTGVEGKRRAVVFGAGSGGAELVEALVRDSTSTYAPVALLDDDESKRRLQIAGVAVRGSRESLGEVVREVSADVVILAIPSASGQLVAEMSRRCADIGVDLKVLPAVSDLLDGHVGTRDIRSPSELDLLGRREVALDLSSIAGYIGGKRILVTGAGGSIGSELCRQVSRLGPSALFMLDHDESALHAVQLSLHGRAELDDPQLLLADIRDGSALERLFLTHRPQVVFHAAALKHVTLLERFPEQAVRTNIHGSLNVLRSSRSVGVERFVNISSDKAANPINILGRSKRIVEQMTSHFATTGSGVYLSVRFGNVLGSRGSVLTTFRAQVEQGGPLTVTDPNVERYFMTVQEAVQLVIQAGAVGRSGEALVLDMGDPVRIADVARIVAASVSPPARIEFVGLQPGEKLSEDLFGDGEPDRRPVHPMISHVDVPAIDPATLDLTDVAGVLARVGVSGTS